MLEHLGYGISAYVHGKIITQGGAVPAGATPPPAEAGAAAEEAGAAGAPTGAGEAGDRDGLVQHHLPPLFFAALVGFLGRLLAEKIESPLKRNLTYSRLCLRTSEVAWFGLCLYQERCGCMSDLGKKLRVLG